MHVHVAAYCRGSHARNRCRRRVLEGFIICNLCPGKTCLCASLILSFFTARYPDIRGHVVVKRARMVVDDLEKPQIWIY